MTASGTEVPGKANLEPPFRGPAAKAMEIVHGSRQQAYGHPLDNFDRIRVMWSVIFGIEVTRVQFVDAMIAVKLCRNANKRSVENWVDIAGYAEAGGLAEFEAMHRPSKISEILKLD